MRQRYIVIFMLFLVSACHNGSKEITQPKFFRLHEYIEQQIVQLTASSKKLSKKISKDGKQEEKVISRVSWKKELRPFFDADINRSAWFKAFHIDTLKTVGGYHLIYIALEAKLSVRKMDISLQSDTVNSITIFTEKKNSYFSSAQQLIYIPGKGYSIIGNQKVILADPISYEISATIL